MTGPWPAGWRGAWLRPGAQLSDALPQVKGKLKHGGCEALVDEVPGQAALRGGGKKFQDGLSAAGAPLSTTCASAGAGGGAGGVPRARAAGAGAALEHSLSHPLPLTPGRKNTLCRVLAPTTQTDLGGAGLAGSHCSLGPPESEVRGGTGPPATQDETILILPQILA